MKPRITTSELQMIMDCIERTWALIERGYTAGGSGKSGEGTVRLVFDMDTQKYRIEIFSYMALDARHHIIENIPDYIEWNNKFEKQIVEKEKENEEENEEELEVFESLRYIHQKRQEIY